MHERMRWGHTKTNETAQMKDVEASSFMAMSRVGFIRFATLDVEKIGGAPSQ